MNINRHVFTEAELAEDQEACEKAHADYINSTELELLTERYADYAVFVMVEGRRYRLVESWITYNALGMRNNKLFFEAELDKGQTA